jgi:hypothetical protein
MRVQGTVHTALLRSVVTYHEDGFRRIFRNVASCLGDNMVLDRVKQSLRTYCDFTRRV